MARVHVDVDFSPAEVEYLVNILTREIDRAASLDIDAHAMAHSLRAALLVFRNAKRFVQTA